MQRILYVEDDYDYALYLKGKLEIEGYNVTLAQNSITGLESLATNQYDLLLTDLHLNSISGIRLVETAKKIHPQIKTIILTAKPSEDTELESLHFNVDYYLEKSKSLKVMFKYIRTVLSSASAFVNHTQVLHSDVESIVLDTKNRTVKKNNDDYALTPIEFSLLQLFLERKNELLDREEIVEIVWANESPEDNMRKIDVHIKNLRAKMNIFSIITIRGSGYKWNEA
ncbi:response regulator transcription factor [Erysipelothrix sp. HDW6C]|uniref:response regulator transcription factor n=1 Tax=Erysipelothrix sp. HDW6C TaxID=2714930 RepID=UPI00140AD4AB|nr:response regulator transcription factor [Erysipelothrix sp. HDW6C]QIK69187.1 response regulator transcription factor [Erysipelothrix sp. HDW6C]